jgi:branched-chain amino acid transport system permease protein
VTAENGVSVAPDAAPSAIAVASGWRLSRSEGVTVLGLAAAVVGLALLPEIVSEYGVSLATSTLKYVILATAWALFSGGTRYFSVATSAFFGIGVYATAVLAGNLPFPIVLLIAAALGFALAVGVGAATLRLRGIYFVIFTFGLSELVRQFAFWWETTQTRTVVRFIFADFGDNELYYDLIALAAATMAICLLIRRWRLGWALRAIGEDETVARHIGINTTAVKVLVFGVSAAIMAMTGAIIAPRWTSIDPSIAFDPLISFEVVIMALLGGIGEIYGPALGAIPLVLLSEYLAGKFPYHFTIIIGLCFIAIVYFMKDGIVGLVKSAAARVARIGA